MYPYNQALSTTDILLIIQLASESIHDEIADLLTQINIKALLARASSLNNGKTCTFTPGNLVYGKGIVMIGGSNFHSWINFEDGEKCIVRMPRIPFSDVPSSLEKYTVASEYATLKFLQSTTVPAPKVYGYGLKSDPRNDVGVSYIFMQAISGTPLPQRATPTQRKKVFGQLANVLDEIRKHPFWTSRFPNDR
jgi:hypothetical protein